MFENNLSAETYSGIMPLLSVNKVAETLGLGRSTVYQLISRGELPAARFGRAVRVRPEDLEEFIAAKMNGVGDRGSYPW